MSLTKEYIDETLNLWPYPTMWWCVCPRNDCEAVLYGPFASYEQSLLEAEGNQQIKRCQYPHFAVKGKPPLNKDLTIGSPCYLTQYPEAKAARRWRNAFYNLKNLGG